MTNLLDYKCKSTIIIITICLFKDIMSTLSSDYVQGVSITIIVLNSLSLISLCFVIIVYIVNWKSIASFPMRLVHMWIQQVILSVLSLLGSRPHYLNLKPDHSLRTRNWKQTIGIVSMYILRNTESVLRFIFHNLDNANHILSLYFNCFQ